MHPERTVVSGGVRLCAQAFGDASQPPILLLAGTSCSMDWWPPVVCAALADRGFYLIRYDQRDSGRSSSDPVGRPAYSLPDLVEDAIAVLDDYGIDSATWAGFSQGGWVSQLAALDHPDRVSSLVLLSTRATGHGPADPDLPEVTDALLAAWAESADEPDWQDHSAVVDYLVEGERILAAEPFDESGARAVASACVNRADQVQSAVTNHPLAEQGPRWRERLDKIHVPTLILHGESDPLFPVGNATALAAQIRRSWLVALSGVGHELPRRVWAQVIDRIDEHVNVQVEGNRSSNEDPAATQGDRDDSKSAASDNDQGEP